MADDPNVTDNFSIWSEDGTKAVTVTTDGSKQRLDVNTTVSASSPNTGKYISVFLKDGTSIDMSVDGSGTPVVFSEGPPTGKRWYIHRIIILARNNGITWANFLGESALSNGVDLDYDSGGVNFDLLDGEPLVRTFNFVRYLFNADIDTATVDIFHARWTFKDSGTVLDLNNTDGDNFNMTINDDLTGINNMTAVIQGFEADE